MIATLKSLLLCAALIGLLANIAQAEFSATPDEARAIAKDTYLSGISAAEMYKTLYVQAVYQGVPNLKVPLNQISNSAYTLYRTQVFDDQDLTTLKQIHQNYGTGPLSSFLGQPTETLAS